MFRFIKKADIVLFLCLICLGILSIFVVRQISGNGDSVEITVNGELYGVYPLSLNRSIEISTEYGRNVVVISDNTVQVKESDCPNHDCEDFGKIGTSGQTIICIPNRLVIAIVAADGENELDAVVY